MNGKNGRGPYLELGTPDTELTLEWLEATKQFLSACIFSSSRFLDLADGLEPEAMAGAAWEAVYRALLQADAAGAVSWRTVLDNLPAAYHAERDELMAELRAHDVLPVEAHVATYVARIRAAYRRARALDVAERLARAAYNQFADMDAVEGQAIEALLQSPCDDALTWISEVAGAVREELEYNIANPAEVRGLACGLVDLDRAVGGFEPNNFVIVGGRPGMGKSSLVFRMARGFAEGGAPGMVITSETSKEMFLKRLACAEVGVDYAREFKRGMLEQGNREQRTENGYVSTWDVLRACLDRFGALPIVHISDSRGPRSLYALAHRMKRAHGIEWFVVDTLNLLASDGGRDEYHAMTDKSRELARIPHELGVTTVVTWQLSRAVEATTDKIPQLSHLRDSGGGEQDGDIVLMVYRPKYYADTGDSHARKIGEQVIGDNEMAVLVRKCRDGEAGRVVPLHFDARYARVSNAAREVEYV